MTTVSSQEFNRNPTSVKRKADQGPVFITERGHVAYVVTRIDDYRRLAGQGGEGLLALLQSDEHDDYDLPLVEFDLKAPGI